ncbi:MAG: diadenylate cyclase CdaA [Clostridia bacterium]|nr:diadenylate cyclase CdaA [Clostridia bacterium]
MEIITSIWQYIIAFLDTIHIKDMLDIAIVAYLIYKLTTIIRETRAQQLIKGILFFIILLWISDFMQLETLNYILKYAIQYGFFVVLVVFQPELRRTLDKVGRAKLGKFNIFKFSGEEDGQKSSDTITAVIESCRYFSETKTGALIVFERETKLGDIIKTGTIIDGESSMQMICNIFFPKSPLHDGAMIIRDNRVYAAGCFLPLSDNQSINITLGTRHRAGLGVSEISDSIVIIVSEETGKISLAIDGVLKRNLTIESLELALPKYLIPQIEEEDKTKKKKIRWGVKEK